MILKDIVDEYKFVYDTLLPCESYFDTANKIITEYFSGISSATSAYFSSSNFTDSTRQTLVTNLDSTLNKSFSSITLLITQGYEFHGALKLLEMQSFENEKLKTLINYFIEESRKEIEACNAIIIAQYSGMKKNSLLPALITPLQNMIKCYHTLLNLYQQFDNVEHMLLEPLPDGIEENHKYCELTLQSLTPTADMDHVSNSLDELKNYFENIGRLCNDTEEKDYYLRKIETGSLLTIFATVVPIICTTIKLIDYCYPKFINWRQLYFTDKSQQLKLATDEIAAVKELLEINPDIPNADELLETATVRLFKYFKLNPNFKVNGKEYKTNMDITLLQDKTKQSE